MMDIIKVLEKLTGHTGPWNDKEIVRAFTATGTYKEDRADIASRVLQGICASGPAPVYTNSYLAKEAVSLADALIEELNKNE